MQSTRRPRWDRSGEPSRDHEDSIWKELQVRENSSSSCRLEGGFLKRRDVTGASSPALGSLPAESDSRRSHPPDDQQDPHSAMPALAVSRPGLRCSCHNLEGVMKEAPEALSVSFCKGSLAFMGPASSLGRKDSPHQAVPLPATPPPSALENCCLVWHLEGLKENSPEDQRLQKLKARIQKQRQLHLSREIQRRRGPDLCSFWEGSLGQQHPLKRKVCKLAMAVVTAAVESPGHQQLPAPSSMSAAVIRGLGAGGMSANPCFPGEERGVLGTQEPLTGPEQKVATQHEPHRQSLACRGRVPRRRKRPGPSHASHVPGKAWKPRGACRFGPSAWREGQRLARKILGPLLEPPKRRIGSEEQVALATLAAGTEAEPGQQMSAPSRVKETPGGGEQRSCRSRQAGAAGQTTGSGQAWEVPLGTHGRSPNGQDLGKKADQQPRPVSRKEIDPGSDGVQDTQLSKFMDEPLKASLLGDPGGPSTNSCGRSSQRSSPLHSPTSGKENHPKQEHRRCSYSLDEVREFMIKKVGERRKRIREAKRASEEACEARKRRLQDVYRKQRAALSRKRSQVEAPLPAEGGPSVTVDKQDSKSGQGCVDDGPSDATEEIRLSSAAAPLRDESKGSSGSSLKMARRAKRNRTPDLPRSPAPRDELGGPLHLRDLAAPSPMPQCSPRQSPLLLPSRPLAGLEALAPTGPLGQSLHKSTHHRIRAVQSLARELSARVESAVAQLQVTKGPVDWGWLPRSLALPERPGRVFMPNGEAPEAFQSPSAEAPLSREGTGHEEGVAVAQATTVGGLLSFPAEPRAGMVALPGRPSSEEKPCKVCMRGPREMQEGGASVLGFPTEGGLSPENPRVSTSRPAPLFFAERLFADSAMPDSRGMQICSEKQPEKCGQEAGLQPARCPKPFHQQETSGLSLPPDNLTHSKAALSEESGDPSEATSQAEIQHLQNVCRAARQRRKLLLKQHKKLLLVQTSTARLWQQMCPRAGTPQHRADAGTPTNFEGAAVLEKEDSAKASSPVVDITTCSGDGNEAQGMEPRLQGRDYNNLHVERRETLPPRTEAAEGCPEQKSRPETPCAELLDATVENLRSQRDPAASPPPRAGSMIGTADQEDPALTTHPKEDHCHASFNKESAPNMSFEGLASEVSFATFCGSSPEMGSLQLDSEFHKAHAVLVNISGSSTSISDLETEATNVSLPEEFVFQEPLHKSCDATGTDFSDAPAVPQVTSEENTLPLDPRCPLDVSWDDSQVDSAVLHSQEKPLDDKDTYQSDTEVLLENGAPRSNSPWAGGSLSSQADMPPDRLDAGYLNTSALLLCAEDTVVFQGRTQLAVAAPLGSASIQCPENQRKQSSTSPIGTAERDAYNGQDRSYPNNDIQPVEYLHEASLKNRDSINDLVQDIVLLPINQMQPFPLTPLLSSKDLSVPDSKTSHTQCSADDTHVSHRREESAAQVVKELTCHEQDVLSLSCAKIVEERAKEHQNISTTKSQKSEMQVLCSSSSNTGKVSQVQSLKSKGSSVFDDNELAAEMEDDIHSPVDEVLTYGSADLPSPDASFPSDDLPEPPEDLSERAEDSSHSTLQDFPPPPEQFLFPETGELEYCMDENVCPTISDEI